jgi:hypothetical protein
MHGPAVEIAPDSVDPTKIIQIMALGLTLSGRYDHIKIEN